MKDKLIIRSRQKWYLYPLILVSLLLLCMIAKIIVQMDAYFFSLRRMNILLFLVALVCFSWRKFWNVRYVRVYGDRIEVKYLFHKEWNSRIDINDLDGCCDEGNSQIYLLTGRKLWLYLSKDDVSNWQEMLSVLTDYCGIPMRQGSVRLSAEERKTVKHGGYVELQDVGDEELAEMRAQKKTFLPPAADFCLPVKTRLKFFFIEYAIVLLLCMCVVTVISVRLLKIWWKNDNKATISYVGADTKTMFEMYNEIDSIDVDTTSAVPFIQRSLHSGRRGSYQCMVSQWLFCVKDRQDIWVLITIRDYDKMLLPGYYARDFCIRQLHKKQTYKLIVDKKEMEKVCPKLAHSTYYEIPDNAVFLSMEDVKETGSYCFIHDEKNLGLTFPVLLQAAEENIADAQFRLGQKYEFGNGTDRDLKKAVRWYKAAAMQDYDMKTKVCAMNQLSYVYAGQKQFEKAITVIDSAITLAPENADLYDSKGEHLFRSGKKEEARKIWEKVLSLEPDYAERRNTEFSKLMKGGK